MDLKNKIEKIKELIFPYQIPQINSLYINEPADSFEPFVDFYLNLLESGQKLAPLAAWQKFVNQTYSEAEPVMMGVDLAAPEEEVEVTNEDPDIVLSEEKVSTPPSEKEETQEEKETLETDPEWEKFKEENKNSYDFVE